MERKVVSVARLLLFVFCSIGIYLLISNLMLRESLKKMSKAAAVIKDKDSQQYKKLQEDIKRDMEEKYRADMISYQVVTKRLEQKKVKQEP
ncbi:MAG: hypothetical protein PHC71_04175 [Candidatus Omnitrophica bacterium]|nr:hypothetical protein [Candidatus Omnitrophota bacterium]